MGSSIKYVYLRSPHRIKFLTLECVSYFMFTIIEFSTYILEKQVNEIQIIISIKCLKEVALTDYCGHMDIQIPNHFVIPCSIFTMRNK